MSYGLLITTYEIKIFKYICVGYDQYKLIKYKSILFKLLMTSFKMLLFLFFLHLIKYSQRNVNMSHYDCIFFLFLYIYSDFSFMYLCFLIRYLMVSDVYLLVNCSFHY